MVRQQTLSFCCTWVRICANWPSLLSSTRFNQVMSAIHFFGFGSTAFRSRAAPPATQQSIYGVLIWCFIVGVEQVLLWCFVVGVEQQSLYGVLLLGSSNSPFMVFCCWGRATVLIWCFIVGVEQQSFYGVLLLGSSNSPYMVFCCLSKL